MKKMKNSTSEANEEAKNNQRDRPRVNFTGVNNSHSEAALLTGARTESPPSKRVFSMCTDFKSSVMPLSRIMDMQSGSFEYKSENATVHEAYVRPERHAILHTLKPDAADRPRSARQLSRGAKWRINSNKRTMNKTLTRKPYKRC